MAPIRPKCWAITNNAPWRYLTASSGLANWAEAGVASAKAAAAMANEAAIFMGFFSGVFEKLASPTPAEWGLWKKFSRNLLSRESTNLIRGRWVPDSNQNSKSFRG